MYYHEEIFESFHIFTVLFTSLNLNSKPMAFYCVIPFKTFFFTSLCNTRLFSIECPKIT